MPDDATLAKPPDRSRRWLGECLRWLLLIGVGFWLFHPFMNGRQIGTGDAVWYHNMLADFVIQWRAGIFPVFVGQTEYAFNGAVYPLRVAPLFQHLAGLIDLLTGRHWSFFALQHATVIVCGFAGLAAAYLTGTRLAPQNRWPACGLAILYLGCPGVLGTIYTQDLYMTWMTVPFLPLAVYGLLRTFPQDDLRSQVHLAAPLAALWFAHSPIALWMTVIAATVQAARLLLRHRSRSAWKRASLGAAVFLVLGQYPFVSVATLRGGGAESVVTAGLNEPERISQGIRDVFPANLRPLSRNARALSDLQLGYSLWAVLLLLLGVAAMRRGALELGLLSGACLMLLVLLLPVPGVTNWVWMHLPKQVMHITSYWPMHRFYLLLAALLAGGGSLAWKFCWERTGRVRPAMATGLALACTWTAWEARQFVRAAGERTASTEATARSQRPENLLLARHAYGLSPVLPAYFSNGVMAPWREFRLLDPTTGDPVDNRAPQARRQRLVGSLDANPGILRLAPAFTLQPGRRYELSIEADPSTTGVLQIEGPTLFREYLLPSSGEPQAFGLRPGNSQVVPLWTSARSPETVQLRFIPTLPGQTAVQFASFGFCTFREIDEPQCAVKLRSLLPAMLDVVTTSPQNLETPRIFVPGYLAKVNGRTVVPFPSKHALVTVPLPSGESRVEIGYVAPGPLAAAYWLAGIGWAALLAMAPGEVARWLRSTPPS